MFTPNPQTPVREVEGPSRVRIRCDKESPGLGIHGCHPSVNPTVENHRKEESEKVDTKDPNGVFSWNFISVLQDEKFPGCYSTIDSV